MKKSIFLLLISWLLMQTTLSVQAMDPSYITATIVAPKCIAPGSNAQVTYSVNITSTMHSIGTSNIFEAQLSDASGTFGASPTVIGTLAGTALTGTINVVIPTAATTSTTYKIRVNMTDFVGGVFVMTAFNGNIKIDPTCGTETIPCKKCITEFAPIPGKKYIISAWVREQNTEGKINYTAPRIKLTFTGNTDVMNFTASGTIIDGWQKIDQEFIMPAGVTQIHVKLENTNANGGEKVYFDDIRFSPFDASMKSFVYDPISLKLTAELDERNYATLYDYDLEGALIRVRKETERGIKTIKESGNNTYKRRAP